METERDNVAHVDMTPGLLRALARELDDIADETAQGCTCIGHAARSSLPGELAAQYRTRALHYCSSTRPGASITAHEGLMSALTALRNETRFVGATSMRMLFAQVGGVLQAFEAYERSERESKW